MNIKPLPVLDYSYEYKLEQLSIKLHKQIDNAYAHHRNRLQIDVQRAQNHMLMSCWGAAHDTNCATDFYFEIVNHLNK